MSTPANFDGRIPAIDRDDAVMLLSDHQTGKKTLIVAGTITSVCMAFPSIGAVQEATGPSR